MNTRRVVRCTSGFAQSSPDIERIHLANLINFGILPLILRSEDDYRRINPDDELAIDNVHEALNATTVKVQNRTQQYDFLVECNLTERQRILVLNGGLLNFTKMMQA